MANFYVIFEFCVRSRSQARFTFSLVIKRTPLTEEAKSNIGLWAFFKKRENNAKKVLCLSCNISRGSEKPRKQTN